MSDQEQQTTPDGGASVSTAGLGGDESEMPSMTHACGCEYVGNDNQKARGTMQTTYIEVSAQVLYWEDATINGTTDTDGTLAPMRKDDCWAPVIRLADGMVMDWPQGTTADVHFKVCDAGEYWLLDDERKRVAKWAGYYVPDDFPCPGDNGYGDYIILKVGADGQIEKWRTPAVEMVCECDEDAQHGWKKLPNDGVKRGA